MGITFDDYENKLCECGVEDGKELKLYDDEENWIFEEGYPSSDLIFHHKYFASLYRRINLKKEEVTFTDTARIGLDDIIDIERKLIAFEKAKIMRQVISVINSIRPVEMPYTPERIKVYVLYDDPYLGILAYRVGKATVKIGKFFDGENEIDISEFYRNIGKETDYVDNDTDKE